MTLFAYLAGIQVAYNRIRLRANGDQSIAMASAADGTSAEAGIVFDDPDSTMSVTGWQSCYVEETACTAAPRLFTGYVTGRTYRRGHYRTDGGREIDTTIFDANVLLQVHRINGSDSDRPAETDTQRLAWLLGSGYIPLVSDLGLVDPADRPFDATEYKGRFPSDVLEDLCATRGQIFFVYWDQAAHALGLFFDTPASTAHTSTLTISNVLSDVNDTTCFAPYLDDESVLDPSEVYSNIRYLYKSGVVYRTNATTAATFFPSPLGHRDTEVENDRIGSPVTATTFADRILARDAVENQSITMTIKLPADKVGLIDAGMRLSVRLSHVPGFTSFAYTRVEQRTVTQTEGTPDFYDVGLRLSTHGIVGGGGTGSGSTLPFPISQSPPPLIQSAVHDGNVTWPLGPPTDGDLLMMWLTSRSTTPGYPIAPTGWTSVATAFCDSIPFPGPEYARLCTRIASSEPGTQSLGDNGYMACIMEWGNATFGAFVSQSDQNSNNSSTVITCGGSITPSAPNAIVVGCAVIGTFGGTSVIPDAGVTELADLGWSGGNPPDNWVGYRTVTSPASTIVGGQAYPGARNEFGGVTFTLIPTAGAEPPAGGQWVYNETPTPAPGGGNTVFYTLFPYANGSLKVWVDQVEQTSAVTESNPAIGQFTLAFDPRSWEVLTVSYQGL